MTGLRRWAAIGGVAGMLWLGSCATPPAPRAPLQGRDNAMRPVAPSDWPVLRDDLALRGLAEGARAQANLIEKKPGDTPFFLGGRAIPKTEYVAGLRRLADLAEEHGASDGNPQLFFDQVKTEFDLFEVYGDQGWGDVFVTGYYNLSVEGSLKQTKRFSQAIYGRPKDLLQLDLAGFDPKFATERKYRGRLDGTRIVPYFSRAEIDGPEQPLKKRAEILLWMDPIDAFFLQVQGSGNVKIVGTAGGKGGRVTEVTLNYSEKNGHRYESIAKFLRGKIETNDLNMEVLEKHLRGLSPEDLQAFLNQNPSYIFFEKGGKSAITTSGAPATDGRTIAVDARFFPLGTVAFLETEKPVFAETGDVTSGPASWEPVGRFMLANDTGGAITGGGRVDLFYGRDELAKRSAAHMKRRGRLWFVSPKMRAVNP